MVVDVANADDIGGAAAGKVSDFPLGTYIDIGYIQTVFRQCIQTGGIVRILQLAVGRMIESVLQINLDMGNRNLLRGGGGNAGPHICQRNTP